MRHRERVGTPEQRLKQAIERIQSHTSQLRLNRAQRDHLKHWVTEATHAVFELHPDLREEGSLPRYFVARAARLKGMRGAAVTAFVEREYMSGDWQKHVPEDVLLRRPKHVNAG